MSPLSYTKNNKNKKKDVRKHWTTYLWSIGIALMSSCAEHDVLIDTSEVANSHEVPISFAGSYVDNAATRHSNELCQHLPTMGVWGWCTDLEEPQTPVFTDQLVAYNPDSARWEYSPLQYWREGCNYTFSAYAPHQQQTDAVVSIDSASRMISIHNVILHGHNLQDTPTDTVIELFRGTPDTDWMVSRSGQSVVGMAGMGVEFVMQHILSKLNVCIKADPALLKKRNLTYITADSIVVGSLAAQGDFVQQLTHTPVLVDPAEAEIEEWTTRNFTLYIKGTHACALMDTPTYLVESLVLPQYIAPESTVTLYYSFHFANGHKEECRYRMPLGEAFTRFASGYNYTLTFTISPQRIMFEAGATDWEKNL